jgi:uncharacterized protein
MPRWPGPLLIVGGALLTLGALSAAMLVDLGEIVVEDARTLAWMALVGAILFVAGLVYSAVRQGRVRRHLPPERYRGPSVLLLLVLILVVAGVLTAPFGSDAAVLLLGEGEMTLLGAIVILLATQAALLLVSWFFVFRPRAMAGWPSIPGRDPWAAAWTGLRWGVLAWIGATIVSVGVAYALEALGIEVDPQTAEQAIQILDPWLVVLAVVIVAPIGEEVFFRGVVFNAWRREGGRGWAYIGSAALFAVIHLSLAAVVPIFLLGLVLARVYERTDSLVAPIVLHAVFNAISVALVLMARFDIISVPV